MISIMNHYTRDCSNIVEKISNITNEKLTVFTDHSDYYKNKKSPLRYKGVSDNFLNIMAHETGDKYKIVFHDDVKFPDSIFDSIYYVLQHTNDNVFCFFHPTNNTYIKAFENYKHVVSTYSNFWPPAMVFKTEWTYKFYDYCKTNFITELTSEDGLLWTYFGIKKEQVKVIVPSLVQHDGLDISVHKNPKSCGGRLRNSIHYNENFNVKGVDWNRHFSNPLYDNRMKILNHIFK